MLRRLEASVASRTEEPGLPRLHREPGKRVAPEPGERVPCEPGDVQMGSEATPVCGSAVDKTSQRRVLRGQSRERSGQETPRLRHKRQVGIGHIRVGGRRFQVETRTCAKNKKKEKVTFI